MFKLAQKSTPNEQKPLYVCFSSVLVSLLSVLASSQLAFSPFRVVSCFFACLLLWLLSAKRVVGPAAVLLCCVDHWTESARDAGKGVEIWAGRAGGSEIRIQSCGSVCLGLVRFVMHFTFVVIVFCCAILGQTLDLQTSNFCSGK